MLDSKMDGVTHINIYSKGKTKLGRLLTNFAHTPFTHAEYGQFASVEGFWYWIRDGKDSHNMSRTLEEINEHRNRTQPLHSRTSQSFP